jgi:hypothetical protein
MARLVRAIYRGNALAGTSPAMKAHAKKAHAKKVRANQPRVSVDWRNATLG